MKEEFKKDAEVIVEIANERGIDNIKSIVEKKMKQSYDEGYRQGIDAAWPWVLVNENDGTEKPFGFCWDDPGFLTEEEAVEQFYEEFGTELRSLIETYLDLSEYETYDDFQTAYENDKVEIDPIILELFNNMYLHNRYTDEDYYAGVNWFGIEEFIESEWDSLK